MTPQIVELLSAPVAEKIRPIRNAPVFETGNVIEWLKKEYRGNKPFGGLWTSSHTPSDEYLCDWQRGRKTNKLVQMALPGAADATPAAYLLQVAPTARIRRIHTLDDANKFTQTYCLGVIPLPPKLRRGIGVTLAAQITDWERAAEDYDAIHLSAEGADAVAYAMFEQCVETSFHTWNCESTLWARWMFDRVEKL